MYQGRLDAEHARAARPRGARCSQALVERAAGRARGAAARHRGGRRGPRARDRAPRPSSRRRPLPGRGRDPPAAGAAGHQRGGVRGVAAPAAAARAAGGAGHRRRGGERRRGGARVPAPQRAGQGSSTCWSTPARYRPGVTPTDDEVQARFEAKREAYQLPEQRVRVLRAGRPRRRCSRGSRSPTRELELYYERAPRRVQPARGGLRQPHPGEGEERARGDRGPADDEAQALAAGGARPGEGGRRLRGASRRRSRRTRARRPQGGDLGCFARGRMVPEFDERGLRARARADVGPGEDQLRLPRHPAGLAAARRRCRRSPRSRSASARAAHGAEGARRSASRRRRRSPTRSPRAAASRRRPRSRGCTVQKSAPFARGETPPGSHSPALVARAFELKPGETEKEALRGAAAGTRSSRWPRSRPARAPELKEVQEQVQGGPRRGAGAAKARASRRRSCAPRAEKRRAREGGGRAWRSCARRRRRSWAAASRWATSAPARRSRRPPSRCRRRRSPSRCARPAGYAVLRVLEKKAFDPAAFEKEKAQLRSDLLRAARSQELFRAYMTQARERFPVERNAEAFRRALGRSSSLGAGEGHARRGPQAGDVVIVDLKGKLTAGLGDQILRETHRRAPGRELEEDPAQPLRGVLHGQRRRGRAGGRAQDGARFGADAEAAERRASACTPRSTSRACCRLRDLRRRGGGRRTSFEA